MKRTLIKVGNSIGLTIPAQWLSEMHLEQGSKVTIAREHDGIFVKPVNPTFNLKELIANTDFEAQRNDPELQCWNNKPNVGRENI